jgi:hypothetical protein
MKNRIKANDNERTVLFMISDPFNGWQKMKLREDRACGAGG